MCSSGGDIVKIECPYCGGEAELVDSKEIYHKSYGNTWICKPCDAYVGCLKGSKKPLGRLANKELRHWRVRAYDMIKSKKTVDQCTINQVYRWLARKMQLPIEECRVVNFTVEQCRDAVKICAASYIGTTKSIDQHGAG